MQDVNEMMRRPEIVMKLARLGSAHQCRISFMRSLLRRLQRERWQFKRSIWTVDKNSIGHAVYQAIGPRRTYSLVAFSHPLKPGEATDRVVATAWDASFTLFDGVPTEADIAHLEQNIPLQEAGRVRCSSLSVSRANRSARLYKHVVESLAAGQQPDPQTIEEVGYLMRTTAVYGSGKLGAADWQLVMDRKGLSGSFQAEMLSVWLTRAFTVDLAEHEARMLGGDRAVCLEQGVRKRIGVGNSTGLGIAPYLVNHPRLLNNWITARETALARVRALTNADAEKVAVFKTMLRRAQLNVQSWFSTHPIQVAKQTQLLADLKKLIEHTEQIDPVDQAPQGAFWDALYRWGEQHLSLEGQELLAMLVMEPYPELVDELADGIQADEINMYLIDGSMTARALLELIEQNYGWALSVDYEEKHNLSRFWYVSEEKLEPRLGKRFEEPGAELEQPLCVGWQVARLYQAVLAWTGTEANGAVLADFLAQHAQYRHTVRRVQQIEAFPYMEIHDNIIANEMSPIDMLRLKLSFFGATNFDPRSDRWIRINMFQYAPFPDQLASSPDDDWAYPPLIMPLQAGQTT